MKKTANKTQPSKKEAKPMPSMKEMQMIYMAQIQHLDTHLHDLLRRVDQIAGKVGIEVAPDEVATADTKQTKE